VCLGLTTEPEPRAGGEAQCPCRIHSHLESEKVSRTHPTFVHRDEIIVVGKRKLMVKLKLNIQYTCNISI
jgi:hypothetical protein